MKFAPERIGALHIDAPFPFVGRGTFCLALYCNRLASGIPANVRGYWMEVDNHDIRVSLLKPGHGTAGEGGSRSGKGGEGMEGHG